MPANTEGLSGKRDAAAPDRSKFRKNTVMQYMLQLAKYVFPFITIPYLTRVLGPDTYAIRAYMLAVMGFLMVVLDYGFTTYGTKVVAEAEGDPEKENPFVSAIMILRVGLSIAMVSVLIGLSAMIPIMSENPVYVALAYASIVMKALLPDFLFQGREDTQIVTSRFVATQIGSIILIFALVHVPQDLIVVPALEAASALVALIWSWLTAIRKCGTRWARPGRGLMRTSLRKSTVFFMSSAATTLINVMCTASIGVMSVSPAQIAYWSVAMTAVTAVQSLYTPLVMSLYPHMCSKRDFSLMRRLIRIGMPCVIAGSVLFAALHDPIMWVLGGEEYMDGAEVMIWIAAVFPFSFMSQLLGYPVLAALGHERELTASTVMAAVFNAAGVCVLGFGGMFSLPALCIVRVATEFILATARAVFAWKGSKR